MKSLKYLLPILMTIFLFSCKNEVKKDPDKMDDTEGEIVASERIELKVKMESKSGTNARGEVTFIEEDGEVRMIASFQGLTEGKHAIHLHESADCSAADGSSAGGHWNPTFEKHGKWGDPDGYHKGDIGNFDADADGNGSLEFRTNEWCIGCGDEKKDIIGKGIIVHAGVDDFVTQPTGDAGGRISCGGIIR